MKIKVHVKNNRWAPGTFPNTPEGEKVFSITQERLNNALENFPELADKLDFFIDWDTDHFSESIADSEVLLTWNFPTENIGTVAPKLKWIHCSGSGVEHLAPMDWMPASLTLTNNKGIHAAKAGEFGLMAVLMLHSHIPAVVCNHRNHTYDSLYASPIAGKTLVVIGPGSLGAAAAKKVQALGVHVIGVNRSGNAVDGCDEVVTTDQLDDVLTQADYLLASAPDTVETRGLMDRRRLNLLKPSAGVINIGREAIMDYEALCDKLDEGSLAGAILDVFDPEPIETTSRLWDTKNLIVTPHISADDGDAYIQMTLDLFFRNMQRYLSGKEFLNPVRPELGY